jgi:3-hydroxyacyl-CoA dehydrogenase/enoyl-CoA hydratase/3-hydroxybutyryl-CoA epimerase
MTLLMVNEAARCLEEGVVQEPEDVDFAMIMGTGFAPFRGGPLRFADSYGMKNIVRDLEQLVDAGSAHFMPSQLLETMARTSKNFYAESGT